MRIDQKILKDNVEDLQIKIAKVKASKGLLKGFPTPTPGGGPTPY